MILYRFQNSMAKKVDVAVRFVDWFAEYKLKG